MARRPVMALAAVAVALAADPASGQAFRGRTLSIEISGVAEPAEQTARQEAFQVVRAFAESLDTLAEDLSRRGAAELTPETRRLLERTLRYCRWSQGAVGPLGREFYRLWEEADYPVEQELERAVGGAGCDALQLGEEQASIDTGAGVELRSFTLGFAVDRAMEALRAAGVDNTLVRLGPVAVASGLGPRGDGWRVELPAVPGLSTPLAPVYLRDRALSFVQARDGELHLDLRTGRPAGEGLVAVFVQTELGVDAQALAEALFAMGTREGDFRAGTLRPPPSVLWLMGSGTGSPLISVRRWDSLHSP